MKIVSATDNIFRSGIYSDPGVTEDYLYNEYLPATERLGQRPPGVTLPEHMRIKDEEGFGTVGNSYTRNIPKENPYRSPVTPLSQELMFDPDRNEWNLNTWLYYNGNISLSSSANTLDKILEAGRQHQRALTGVES